MAEGDILVRFPCGHTRTIAAGDERLSLEATGVRIVGQAVYYCSTCYQQTPRRFTWLEPGEKFLYAQETQEIEPC